MNKWLTELKLAQKEQEKWEKRGTKIVKRYRDERQGAYDPTKRYNILWANVQTIFPALYGKTPRAQVERRWKDQDPIARTSAVILERALQYEIDHFPDFDQSMNLVVNDRLLPGRGTAWLRFEVKPTVTQYGTFDYECTPVDYVFWKDFRHSPARTWDEVTWVARRVYMTREDGIERFGDDFKTVPLTHEPVGLDEMRKQGMDVESMQKAQVWELWDKSTKKVYWVAEGFDGMLDERDDPYGLEGFWPCPRPLFATTTSDSLCPVPDYALYQDQAEEMDMLTNRIAQLVQAVKVVGVYDASHDSVQRMMNEGVNNTLIPVDTWAAFGEKGGLKGVIDFLPLDQVVAALAQCYAAREQAKAVIFEITGISDILRGASMASETATAQQIKAQYASLRLRKMQKDVAEFASEILRIKAQMMCDFYSPQTLIDMSGIMGTNDGQYAEQAVMLLKQEQARNYRIEVAADSLIEIDEQSEKQNRVEFLTAVGGFMQQALPVAQAVPEMAPIIAEMLLFGVRAFKGGRPLEAAFDTAMAQLAAPQAPQAPQGPSPEEMAMQAQMQAEQAKMAQQQQVEQAKLQLEQAKLQAQMQIEQFKAQQAAELEQMRQAAETERAKIKAQIEAESRIAVAQIQAQQRVASDQMSIVAQAAQMVENPAKVEIELQSGEYQDTDRDDQE